VKILILNNKDVMEQSLFALVTTDPGFYRATSVTTRESNADVMGVDDHALPAHCGRT
jgi:hypothetical protein